MKWIFKKENEECKVMIRNGDDVDVEFSYIDMIKNLFEEKKLEQADFEGEFSDGEKESVDLLINEINCHVQEFFENVEGKISNV